MNKNLLRSTVFAFSTFLFTMWILLILINWNYIQNLRHSDPLWLVKGVSPWLYVLITIYVFLFLVILNYDLTGKLFHLIFISYLVLIIDSTPYFLSTLCRFPDTIVAVKNSVLLPEILSGSITHSYPKSFPISYMLFHMIHSLTGIDLFMFSRSIFSPMILIGIFTIWYLFVDHFYNSRVAFISAIIAIPSQIIEVTISPNSVSIILVLISLLLCISNKWSSRIAFLIVVIALVLTHSINSIVLLVVLLFFYFIYSLLNSYALDISRTKICSFSVIWISWIFSASCTMGVGIIKTVHLILTLEKKDVETASTYTFGSGGLGTYSWIQTLQMYKYELYALVLVLLIVLDFYFILSCILNKSKKDILKKSTFVNRYSFLAVALILLALTLLNLTFGGSDTQNIISRTLNYSMFFVSLFIASSIYSVNTSHISSFKVLNVLFIIFLLLAFITYPLYSYGRDSYINYPETYERGYNFFESNIIDGNQGNSTLTQYSKSDYFYQVMHGEKLQKDNIGRSTVYTNGWYSIYD